MSTVATWFFTCDRGRRKYGWSESLIVGGSPDLPNALESANEIAVYRSNLLGAGATLDLVRVSKTDVFRDSDVIRGPYAKAAIVVPPNAAAAPEMVFIAAPGDGTPPLTFPGPPLFNPALGKAAGEDLEQIICDQPATGLILRMEGPAPFTSRRSYTLRGVPDGIVNTSTNTPSVFNGPVSGAWLGFLDAWVAELKKLNFRFLSNNRGAANPRVDPTVYEVDVPSLTVSVTIPGLNAQVGQSVRIGGVRFLYANGTEGRYSQSLKVDTKIGDTYTFRGTVIGSPFYQSAKFAQGRFLAKGKATLNTVEEVPITIVQMVSWDYKKTGRAFDTPKVRSKKKK